MNTSKSKGKNQMKNIILILCMMFLLAGCADNNNVSSLSEETTASLITETSENGYEIVSEEQYYRVYGCIKREQRKIGISRMLLYYYIAAPDECQQAY